MCLQPNALSCDDQGDTQMTIEQVKNFLKCTFVFCIAFCLISCGSGSTGEEDATDTASITLAVDTDSIPADGVRSLTITATLTDANGDAVPKGTQAVLKTNLGTFANGKNSYAVATQDYSGVITAALISGTTAGSALVSIESNGVYESINVQFTIASNAIVIKKIEVDPASLQVKETGGVEVSQIIATITDEYDQPLEDSFNNVRFKIIASPGNDEMLDSGDGAPARQKNVTTVDGIASILLKSGTLSGTVRIQIEVLKDTNGAFLPTPITAVSTKIGIESGSPYNLSLYTSPTVQDNKDGSISWTISALVQDQYGNPVADGTAVYFGIVDNILTQGSNGQKNIDDESINNLFHSENAYFGSKGVTKNDTLVILNGKNEGGHAITDLNIKNNSCNDLEIVNDLIGTETNLNFVVGNAEFGSVCGVVFTSDLEPNAICEPSTGSGQKGVAHTRVTWGEPGIWKPFYIYAESEGKEIGAVLTETYPAIEPVTIDVALSAETVSPGTQVTVTAHLCDGGDHDIRNVALTFTSSDKTVAKFNSTGTESAQKITDSAGKASVAINAIKEGSVTISASISDYRGDAELTIE